MDVIQRLRERGLPLVLADLLGLKKPPRPGSAIRCVYPQHRANGDAHRSLVISKNGAGARCLVCRFGGGVLDIAMDRFNLPDRKAAAAELERRYLGSQSSKVKPGDPTGPPEAVYDYEDEEGDLRNQIVRYPTVDAEGPELSFSTATSWTKFR